MSAAKAAKKPAQYVAVAGTIGAGKTSLVGWLEKRYGLTPAYEPNEANPYLADFYADMPRWAFHSQAWFLSAKFALHQELETSPVPVVVDRTIYEDAEIFARNLARTKAMSKRDWELYESLYRTVKQALRPPDVLIALTCSLRAAKQRIKTRGRPMEQGIPHAYLARLHRSYAEWFARYDLSEIVVIDTTKLDYVEDMVALIDLTSRLDRVLR